MLQISNQDNYKQHIQQVQDGLGGVEKEIDVIASIQDHQQTPSFFIGDSNNSKDKDESAIDEGDVMDIEYVDNVIDDKQAKVQVGTDSNGSDHDKDKQGKQEKEKNIKCKEDIRTSLDLTAYALCYETSLCMD